MAELNPISGTPEWLPMAVGSRRYGLTGSSTATSGAVDKTGYRQRDRDAARRRALQERLSLLGSRGYDGSGTGRGGVL